MAGCKDIKKARSMDEQCHYTGTELCNNKAVNSY